MPPAACDVLYVHPTKTPTSTDYSIMPVGVFSIVNLLIANGYDVRGINLGVERSLDRGYDLAARLRDAPGRALLLDLHWYEHAYGAIEVARLAKQAAPGVPVVIGGFTATVYAREILEQFDCVDYVVKGDSEEPTLALIEHLLRGRGSLEDVPNVSFRAGAAAVDRRISYRRRDLEGLDFVSSAFLEHREHYYFTAANGIQRAKPSNFWLAVARGCSFECEYCSGSRRNNDPLFGSPAVVKRSPEALARDILRLARMGVRTFSPTHDLQMFGRAWYEPLFAAVRAGSPRPGVYHECFQLPQPQFLAGLHAAFDPRHTTVVLSPLCADERLRRANGKGFSNARYFETLDWLAERQVPIELFYSMNLLGDDEGSFERTLAQIEEVAARLAGRPLTIYCQPVSLDPLAPMRDHVTAQLNTFRDYYEYCRADVAARPGYDGVEELVAQRTAVYAAFKARMRARRPSGGVPLRIF